MARTVASKKSKGRRLQQAIADLVRRIHRLAYRDVRSTPMGVTGPDVQLSDRAFKAFPYNVECKNQEITKTIYGFYGQAEAHGEVGEPVVFIKMNRRPPLAVVDAEHFVRLTYGARKNRRSARGRSSSNKSKNNKR